MALSRSAFLAASTGAAAAALVPARAFAAAAPATLGIDYAYYNPPSIVLRKFGWLEEALKPGGTSVSWVLSLGSNKANQFLAANAVQFGSTAGAAALLARANGAPIKTVYLFSQPEWTAIVVGKDSKLASLRDLKGKKIAATRGTDPWFFLLRALRTVGLDQPDVEIVDLQHPDGRTALERGQVDAWAGLDPHMAASQLDAGSKLIYRNVAFNTFGALNVREDFAAAHPDTTVAVLKAYERARRWAEANREATAKLLADEAKLDVRVAAVEVRDRTRYPNPTPGVAFRDAIDGVVPIVRAERLTAAGVDVDGAAKTLTDTSFATKALAR
jgi:sulfonate transport system substrate-binding protein